MSVSRRTRALVGLVAAWLIGVSVWATYYVQSVLSGPPSPDLYANNAKFQLLAFGFVRLPIAILVLVIGLGAVLRATGSGPPK